MERAMLWFICAAERDPVRPVLKKPAVIGWEAKQRQVDLVIERPFKGDELVRRMKGWVTADVNEVITIIQQYGKLRVLDDRDLVVEFGNKSDLEMLSRRLAEVFEQEVWIEPIPKTASD